MKSAKLKFYSGLAFGVITITLALYDIYLHPDGSKLRAIAGIVMGVLIVMLAWLAGLRHTDSGGESDHAS